MFFFLEFWLDRGSSFVVLNVLCTQEVGPKSVGYWDWICLCFYLLYIYAFYLDNSFSVWLCWFICFFSSPPQWPMTSDFEGFLSRFYPLHFCPIVILEKEPVFCFWMLSAKQYHFYNVFGMTRSLTGTFSIWLTY